MGGEVIAAIVGPLLGGVVSVILWIGNRNAKTIDAGFAKLQTTMERVDVRINSVDDKVDELRQDVAENYVTNSRFEDHIDLMATLQSRAAEELSILRQDIKESKQNTLANSERLRSDISEIKEMQWKTRLGILDLIDRKLGRHKYTDELDVNQDLRDELE